MTAPDDLIACAVDVTTTARRLIDASGAFTSQALRDNLNATGWREDEITAVLSHLSSHGWLRPLPIVARRRGEEPTYVAGQRWEERP